MPPSAARRATPLPAAVDPIEEGLRELFRSMVEEPLPDEFKALLDRMDAAGQPPATGGGAAAPKGGLPGVDDATPDEEDLRP